MSTAPEPLSQSAAIPSTAVPPVSAPTSAERWMTELNSLLRELEAVTVAGHTLPPVFSRSADDQLVQIRLGVAAGLFAALQCKNAAVAGHALRVALSSSAWATKMELSATDREAIELAALLHDVGVIGAPDHVLLKPAALDHDESAVMARARKMSLEILRRGCASEKVLEIVEHVPAWYDGSRTDFPLRGCQMPLGARMIAIVEAFDAMTTDHVYRPARSRKQAMGELCECSGMQFDPELTHRFAEFCLEDQTAARWEAAHRWLRTLDPAAVDSYWETNFAPLPSAEPNISSLFQGQLLDNMYDAVMFVDTAGRVVLWNRGAERLTGIDGTSVRGQTWRPMLLELADEKGNSISESDCPMNTAIRCGVQSLRRLRIRGRGRRMVAVDAHAIPVIDRKGVAQGAVLLFHDASSETSLERRCQNLHEKSTKDPLTQTANRAEFDRVHTMFIAAHRQQQVPCSLIMCDLDRFKQVNDTYGHQAGDEVILSLVSLLKSSCRPGDLVARYGGEEFVILCADCDNDTAARRSEQIRKSLSQLAQTKMEGRAATVSFGVTEIQPGDTPETMLRRADRALLMAKANGRNTVVQLGGGIGGEPAEENSASWRSKSIRPKQLLEQDLVTPVPVRVAIEKLRGFVADHQARIVSINGNRVCLEIDDQPAGRIRRLTDRSTVLLVELLFEEERLQNDGGPEMQSPSSETTRTKIQIVVGPRTDRNRRSQDVTVQARELLTSFRSYLMASEEWTLPSAGKWKRIKRIIAPWLTRK